MKLELADIDFSNMESEFKVEHYENDLEAVNAKYINK